MEFFQKRWELRKLKIKYIKLEKWEEKIKRKELKYETSICVFIYIILSNIYKYIYNHKYIYIYIYIYIHI